MSGACVRRIVRIMQQIAGNPQRNYKLEITGHRDV